MVNLVCSPDLRMFLCALYAPVCVVYGQVSMPCRSLCQRARDECHKLMEIFDVPWPEDMECSRCVCSLFFKFIKEFQKKWKYTRDSTPGDSTNVPFISVSCHSS